MSSSNALTFCNIVKLKYLSNIQRQRSKTKLMVELLKRRTGKCANSKTCKMDKRDAEELGKIPGEF